MPSQKQTFNRSEDADFFSTLKARVNAHFESTNESKQGNWSMYVKTVLMFFLYFAPYVLLLTGAISNPGLIIASYALMGLGMLGIGLGVMHDAIHGAYSRKRWVNKYLGYSMNLIGANAKIWEIQHNVLHHYYTNIQDRDDDINVPPILRLTPYKKKLRIHKLQFIYAWLIYGLSTLARTTAREFVQAFRYRKNGMVNGKRNFYNLLVHISAWKLFYYSYILVIPLIFVPAPAWVIIVAYLTMHFVTGVVMSAIFQTAHLVPECDFPVADKEGEMGTSWVMHELKTTSNFAPESSTFTWLIGGLNYQIEHHLFPTICHVHYKKLSKIVAQTAHEFNLPYKSQKTFGIALLNHIKMLYRLGRVSQIAIPKQNQ